MTTPAYCSECSKLKPYQDSPDARWYYPCPCKVPMTESKCPVSRIDGEGKKHPCLNPHGHSGEHRYTLAWCPATKGDCSEPCVGSNCNKLEGKRFPAAVANALEEAARHLPCGSVSPIGASMTCDLEKGHTDYHQNKKAMSSWPDGYALPAEEPHAMNTMRERVYCQQQRAGEGKHERCVLPSDHDGGHSFMPYQSDQELNRDPIRPDYYHGTAVDDFIDEFNLGFRLGNAVKYIARHEHKDGIKDLKKALWYLTTEIEKHEAKQ